MPQPPFIKWQPSPTTRGTSDIISSCLSTLTICVINAIHVDVLESKYLKRRIMTKIRWLLLGLVAPELVLLISYFQRQTAVQLTSEASSRLCCPPSRDPWYARWFKRLLSCTRNDTKDDHFSRKHPWTLTHSYYATMGGFALELSDDEPIHHSTQNRALLTVDGLRFIIEREPDLIPDILEDDILDRSKASGLSKAILILQVLWFCVHCISRLYDQLPLALLEISTFAHGLCTLATYVIWWSKPLDVQEPHIIRGVRAQELCALMLMCSRSRLYIVGGVLTLYFDCERAHLEWAPISTISNDRIVYANTHAAETSLRPGQTLSGTGFSPSADLAKKGSDLPSFFLGGRACSINRTWHKFLLKVETLLHFGRDTPPWYAHDTHEGLTVLHQRDMRRWMLASIAMERYALTDLPGQGPFVSFHAELDVWTDGARGRNNRLEAVMVTFLILLHAVPHFFGWNADFETSADRFLWRGATVSLFFYPITFSFQRLVTGWSHAWRVSVIGLVIMSVVYPICSLYLVYASFRQVFALPPEAFELPSWGNNIPHIS
ncbi:hypothetical protein OF83DRAFT_1091824 [Amylostereum chailletii]|nr:hypothetical protein OF83DRAFT_1091824 [Amylostereum chailletii]